MTPAVDDHETLRRTLANTEALLLDFDGPICSVFSGIPARIVADQLRQVLAEGGNAELPDDIRTADDPFDVLFYAAKLGPDEARYVESAFRAHEVEAVQSAEPTPSTIELMCAWQATGRPLAIVSNNSTSAVQTYLDLHDLRSTVTLTSARTSADIALLKPSPYLINRVTGKLGMLPSRCTLVGDSAADMHASRTAHVKAIGYANKPGKVERLTAACADMITTDMGQLLAVLPSA